MNELEVSAIKDNAERYFSKQQFGKAAEEYEKLRPYFNKDARLPLRLGDIYRKTGKNEEAVDAYKNSANAFIAQGFITKAIGVCKMIIDIDPSQEDAQKKIVDLYTKKGFAAPGEKKAGTKFSKEAEEKVDRIGRTPLFSDLNREELMEFIPRLKHYIISPGVLVFREGDSGNSIFVITNGSFDVLGRDKSGHDVILAGLKDGDFFGEFGFFSGARREATVRAAAPASVLEISKDDVNAIIAKHKRVEQVMFEFYKERVVDRLMALSPIFHPLSHADRKMILSKLSSGKFAAGESIVRQGETGDTMYLIKYGNVKVWIDDQINGRIVMADLSQGDFFGEIALATTKPRVANVTATTNTEVILFARSQIKDVLTKYPDIKKILEKIIKSRVIDTAKARGLQAAALV